MPNATPDLPGIGAVQPDKDAYKPRRKVSIEDVRDLGRDNRTLSMRVTEHPTDKGPKTTFRAVFKLADDRQITVNGEIEG